MKSILLGLVMLISSSLFAQQEVYQTWEEVAVQKAGQLNVYYFNNYPFAYVNDIGEVEGIEIEILRAFSSWVQQNIGTQVNLNFKQLESFEAFYETVKNGQPGSLGSGAVSVLSDRKKEVDFTKPYLKNTSVLVSSLDANSLAYLDELRQTFHGRTALTIKGTSHEKSLLELQKRYWEEMPIEYVDSPAELLSKMLGSKTYFGYVDIIDYWSFTQTEGAVFRLHRVADVKKELMAFILPMGSDWLKIFNDFMQDGGGFVATAEYHRILNKYLDVRITGDVELK